MIIDQQAIDDLTESVGKELMFNRLIPLFCDELQSYSDELKETQHDESDLTGRAKRLASIAHMLKSSGASFGARSLVLFATEIDKQYKVGELNQVQLINDQQKILQGMIENNLTAYRRLL